MKKISNLIKQVTGFFRSIVLELKLVEWWTFGQVVKSTVVVILIAAIFVVVLTGMDQLLVQLRGLLLSRPII